MDAFTYKDVFKKSDNADAWNDKGRALADLKNYYDAVQAYEKAIEIDPKNTIAWNGKGRALYHLKNYYDAVQAYEKAIEIDPKNKSAWNGKGNVLYCLKKYDKAVQAYEKAIEIDSMYNSARFNKGNALYHLKKYDEALKAYEKAIEINKGHKYAWTGKGNVLYSLKKYDKAVQAYEKAIEIDPKNTIAWNGKGNALADLKNYYEALKAYEKAIENDKEIISARCNKGTIFSELGLRDRALDVYEEAINIDQKIDSVWMYKAAVLFNLEKYIQCKEAIEQAFNIDSKNVFTNYMLALYYLTFGDLQSSSKYAENALKVNRKDARSLCLKGKIKIDEQDYVKSSEFFKKAISSDLGNPTYLLWDSYAKYLRAESAFASNTKMYQDMILAIIRELERINACDYPENKSNFKKLPHWIKNYAVKIIRLTKRTLIYFSLNDKITVFLLEKINSLLTKIESPKILAYNYYFMGCFYYKINDYSTAVDSLKKCKNSILESDIERSARETLDNIWNNKVRPSIWEWWWYSPLNHWPRRFTFVILILSLLGILLPSVASKLIFSAYDSLFEPLFAYQRFPNFPIIQSLISTVFLSIGSFFSSIDWKTNTIPLTFLTLIILFILVLPNIQHFKGSQIEIEIRPPPVFELIPSTIEKRIKDLE